MKRIFMFAFALVIAAGFSFAQTGNRPDPGPRDGVRLNPPEKSTISGNLGISRGMISLESGGVLYFVWGLNRFIGFIDGLTEGAEVSLEGYAFDSPRLGDAKVFRVTELRLNGKNYDVAPPVESKPRRLENRPQGWSGFPRDYSGHRRGCYGRGPRHGWDHSDRPGLGPWSE